MCEYVNLALSTEIATGDPVALDSGFFQVLCTAIHTLDADGMAAVKKGAQASIEAANSYDKSVVVTNLQNKINAIDQALNLQNQIDAQAVIET